MLFINELGKYFRGVLNTRTNFRNELKTCGSAVTRKHKNIIQATSKAELKNARLNKAILEFREMTQMLANELNEKIDLSEDLQKS